MEPNAIGGRRLTNEHEVRSIASALDSDGHHGLADDLYREYWGLREDDTYKGTLRKEILGEIALAEPKEYLDLDYAETELAMRSLEKVLKGRILSTSTGKMDARKFLFEYEGRKLRFYHKFIGTLVDMIRPGV